MQRRIFKRIPANIKIRFFSGKAEYPGTITNLSERGMFINTRVNFPLEEKLEILIPLRERILKFPARIRSFGKTGRTYDGIGVELLKAPKNYLEFIDNLKSS